MAPNQNDPPAPERAPGGGRGMSKREALAQQRAEAAEAKIAAFKNDDCKRAADFVALEAQVRELREALEAADAAINPPDRSRISLYIWNERLKAATQIIRQTLFNTKDKSDFEKARNVFPAPEEAEAGGHNYPGTKDPDDFWTSDCSYGCGAWMGAYRSGAPEGIDPFGKCPNAPQTKDKSDG